MIQFPHPVTVWINFGACTQHIRTHTVTVTAHTRHAELSQRSCQQSQTQKPDEKHFFSYATFPDAYR